MIGLLSAFLLAAAVPARAADADSITVDQALTRILGTAALERPADPPSSAAVELGRKLFFDPRLSSNGTVSCAKCHNPGLAWRDGLPRARGLTQQELPRRAPSLLNVNRTKLFFWDGRADSFAQAALAAIQNPDEMNRSLADVVRDLKEIPGYANDFRSVFGAPLEPAQIGAALEAFVRTETRLPPSPFDRFAAGDRAALSPEARLGAVVFASKGRCQHCHAGASFSDGFFHNTGVKQGGGPEDAGRFKVTPFTRALRAFKTVPLRNVALTGPYMHNGSLKTLADVVEFYDRGGDAADERDFEMKPLNLTPEEKRGLVAFLESLTNPPRAVDVPSLPLARADAAGDAAPESLAALTSRAEARASEIGPLLASLAGGGARARCLADFSVDGAVQDYDGGKVPAAVAADGDKGQAILEDLLFNLTYRTALTGDMKICDSMTAPVVYAGIVHPGAFWCRELYLDAASALLLTKRSPGFDGVCRQWLTTTGPKTTPADAESVCRLIRAEIDDPVRLCADLVPRYVLPERRAGCEAEYGRYTRFDRPDACEGVRGGTDSLFARCDDYVKLARAVRAGDPKLCGQSEICLLLTGAGAALPAKYENQAKTKYCDAVDEDAVASGRDGRDRGARLLRGAEEDVSRAEAARSLEDRAAARRIDAAAEKLARARRRFDAAAAVQVSAASEPSRKD